MNKINILQLAVLTLFSADTLLAEDANTSKPLEVTPLVEKTIVIEKQIIAEDTNVSKALAITPVLKKTAVIEKETIAPEPTVIPQPSKETASMQEKKVFEPVKKTKKLAKQSVPKAITPPKAQKSDVVITMPLIPEVPQVQAKVPKLIVLDADGNLIEKDKMEPYYTDKEVIFSTNVAPPRFNRSVVSKKEEILAGDIINSRVTAYLQTRLMDVKDVEEKLKAVGFKILATYKVDKKGVATSIVFTNEAMNKAASQNIRGFAGTLRILVDKKNKIVNISNPIYLMKAFMQKDYDKKIATDTLKAIRSAFPGVRNSEEMVKFRVLERFRFMENMPYYQDMKVVSTGDNKALLKKAKKSKKVVYTQHLSNGSIIVGVKLGKRTSKFVKKIGYQNSGLLPYPVLIENGEAKILAPQYYIAVMYPMLKMSQFMKIATVPGAIAKDIDRVFR